MQPTILIIDDNENDVLLTQIVLTKISGLIKVESALSGESGLAFLCDSDPLPSLILLDLKMPGMNGIDVLRRIHDIENLRNIPVIIVTNSDLDSDKQVAIQAGADFLLSKSSNLDLFKNALERVLERWLDIKSLHLCQN